MFNANGQLNEEGDVLESDVLVTKEKQREINKLREKAKMPMWERTWRVNCRYTGLDDNEFDSDFDEEDRLLPQYAEKKKKDVGFILTDEGVSKEDNAKMKLFAAQRSQTETKPKITAISGNANEESKSQKSLDSVLASLTEKKIATEYYTNEEMAQFKKKKRRVRKVRKIEKEPLEELQLNEMEEEKRGREQLVNEEEEKLKEKRLGFEKAREKEEAKNRGLKSGSAEDKEGVVDDVLLQDQLLRARRVVLGQRRKTPEEVGILWLG